MIETSVAFEMFRALPIPEMLSSSSLANRVIRITAKISAIDDRFSDWAAVIGIPCEQVKESKKTKLLAELDASVSLLYGLEENEVKHVFETFHESWDPTERLAQVLHHYHELQQELDLE